MKDRHLHSEKALRAALLVLLLSVVGSTKADPVDMRTVREVAIKFVNANTRVSLRGEEDLQLVTTYKTESDDAAFHIFNTPNGFVIVSADDCATPILGYSDEGQFDTENIPIQMQDYLQDFVDQIQYGIENQVEADEQTARQWELVRTTGRLSNNRSNRTVEPLITAMWDQGCYYNEKCPEDWMGMCGHAVTGCVATAMAQIMHYWGYPENGAYSNSYTPLDPYTYMPSGYPEQSVNFGATTYDWDNMPNQLDENNTYEQIDAVAMLMWHCGVSVDMMYSSNLSGAYSYLVEYALKDYFTYSNELSYEYKSEFSDASWKAKLKDCLNLGRPVYYDGSEHSLFGDSGHAFVCDGYDSDEMFHFNWGWSGEGNGYFAIGALNVMYYEFNNDNTAIFNIHPQGETTNYVINVTVNNDEGGTVSGGGTFAHGENVILMAIADDGYGFCYWEENGGIVSTDPNYSFTANYNRDLVAVFAGPFSVTVSAEEGGVATGGGSYYYGEPCLVIASANEGYAFSFWTDNGEVVSYDANYIFPVTGQTHLIAHFVSLEGNIVFADGNVKAICVANWDINGDGMLSYEEAASVTNLGEVFRGKSNIYSFKELQYFTNLTSISNYAFYCCSGLTSLIIPNAVTSIGNSAFQYCSNLTGSLIIPNSVISIGDNAFNNCSGLTSLTIGNSVSLISNSAFYYCNGLTSLIVLAETPPTLGTDAFRNVSTDIPVFVPCFSVEAYQATEGWSAFSNIMGMCSSGTVSVVSDPSEGGTVTGEGIFEGGTFCTVNAIPNEEYGFAFWTENGNIVSHDANYSFVVTGDSQLIAHFIQEENIVFADANVKDICVSKWDTNGDGELSTAEAAAVMSLGSVFRNNTTISSFEELQYFIGLTSIGKYAFQDCSGLVSLTFPNSVTTIGDSSFSGCAALVSLDFPNSITTIGSSAFSRCIGLVSLSLSCSVVEIGSYAFFECTGLTGSLVIPNSVTTIGNKAFSGCTGLTGSLVIPNSVATIGDGAFSGCIGLNAIYYMGNIHQWCNIQFSGYTSNPLYFVHNLFIDNELVTDLVIPETVTEIKNYAFYGATCLTSLTIPNSVTSIGGSAFRDCSGMTGGLVIPNSVTTIGGSAFYGCTGLTGSLVIPNSVTTIGSSAFSGCNGFTGNLVISNSVSSISDYAFQNCSGFTGDLTIPNSVTTIGERAFENCTGFIGALTISNSVTQISKASFAGCNGFTGDLIIPNSVVIIEGSSDWEYGGGAFFGCSGFDGILSISESVTMIERDVFHGCRGFTGNLIIPNSVTAIDESAFGGCSGFSGSLVIPNSVITIGDYAFDGCRGLTSLTIGNSVTSIGDYAFFDCYGLTSLTIGNSVTSIGNYAFCDCYHLEAIFVLAEIPPTMQESFHNCSLNIPIYVPCESVGAYQYTQGWNIFYNVIGMCSSGTITVASEPFEGGIVTGAGVYEPGTLCTVSASPNENYTFMYWTENETVVSSDANYSFIVALDHDLVAHFSLPLTVSVTTNMVGGGTVSGGGTFNYGTTCTLTATPNPGYVFNNWTKNGSIVSCLSPLTINVTGSAEYVANFQQMDGIVIGGAVSSSYYLPTYHYYSLTEQIYTAEEMGGEATEISSVSFYNTGTYSRTRNMSIYMVNTNKTSFGNNTDWISVTDANLVFSGSVTFATNNWNTIYFNTPFNYDGVSNVALIVDDNSNSYNTYTNCRTFNTEVNQAIRISGSGTNYDPYAPNSYTGTLMSEKNQVIFGIPSYDYMVTATANPEEGGTVSGGGLCYYNQLISLVATPNTGYYFVNWTENGTSVSYEASYSFSVGGDRNLVANFAEGEACSIVFDLYDSYGDGWNGNYLVLDYGDGNSEHLTINSGSFASYSRAVATGSHITLTWIMGSWTTECSFTVHYMDGDTIYEGSNIGSNFEYSFDVDCSGGNVTQTIALSQGSNYCSFNVEITLDDLKDALVAAFPNSAISIKSKTQTHSYNPVNQRWTGAFDTFDLGRMNIIKVDVDGEITMQGLPVDPADHSVTITEGSNYLAFPLSESMTPAEAFAGFAVQGDKIKSKTATAVYNRGQWGNQIPTLEPGQGYIYISNLQGSRIFTFPTGTK